MDLPRGRLELVLLALLREPAHGYALIEQMRAQSGGALEVPEGSVYPALYRLEGDGLVMSTESPVNGRLRRVYRLTDQGNEALRQRTAAWNTETTLLAGILKRGQSHGT